MKNAIYIGAVILMSQLHASGTKTLDLDLSDKMENNAMDKKVDLKTFKCKSNEKLITCTRRFKKLKAMMENN